MSTLKTPFEGLGEQGIRDLVERFYDIMDRSPEAASIRKMHGEDLSGIKQGLSNYLIEWMGGPRVYSAATGGMCMTTPHKGYWIGPKERDEWLWCMRQAMAEAELSAELVTMLSQPFERIADAVRNQEGDNPAERDDNIIAAG